MKKNAPIRNSQTPVDDVRKIRQQRHEKFGGDLRKQAEDAHKTTAKLIEKLGLKPVTIPTGEKRRDGTRG